MTLYGLGVGFLTLLFGVLYTVEMSLQTAQLNEHNPDHSFNIRERGQAFLHRGSGDSKKDNNEEEDSDSQSVCLKRRKLQRRKLEKVLKTFHFFAV